MAAADITLQQLNVNGNVAVECKGATVKYTWKNIVRNDAILGKSDIAEVEYGGFQNPIIIITGVIDVDDDSANMMTQSLLFDFAQCVDGTNNLVLTVTSSGESGTGTHLKGRPAAGYSVGGSYTDSLNIVIKVFSMNFGAISSREGRIWSYSIECVETA